jgi:hypothetical protein
MIDEPEILKRAIAAAERDRITPAPIRFSRDVNRLHRGGHLFLICGGPSLQSIDPGTFSRPGLITMGINNSARTIRPDYWIGGDDPGRFLYSVWRDPRILKFIPDGRQGPLFDSARWEWTEHAVSDSPGIIRFACKTGFTPENFLTSDVVRWGDDTTRFSMTAALRVAIAMGFCTVNLVGCDWRMCAERPYGFDEGRPDHIVADNNRYYSIWSQRFADLRPIFERAGVDIRNTNPTSHLKAFRHVPLEQAIAEALEDFDAQPDMERTRDMYCGEPQKPPQPVTAAKAEPMPMKLSVITMTGDRPEAFALCERWMKRQTIAPDEWIVVDDGKTPTACTMGQRYLRRDPKPSDPPNTLTLNLMHALDAATGDAIVIVEDDDWYAPDYLEWMLDELQRLDVAGEGNALYYHVGVRRWREFEHDGHASLCSTGFRRSVLQQVRRLAQTPDPFIDTRIWKLRGMRKRVSTTARRVIGIKGMPGRTGTGVGHRPTGDQWNDDPDLMKLRSLIGADADAYSFEATA